MKQKVSLAFTLLAVYCLLTLSNLQVIVTGIVNLFTQFNPMGIVYYALNVASALRPLALVAILYLSCKKDIKRESSIVCLVCSILDFYGTYRILLNIITFMMGGANIFDIFPMLGNLAINITCGIMFILAYRQIASGKQNQSVKLTAYVGGFIYFFIAGVCLLLGLTAVGSFLRSLLLLIGLCYLPATIIDQEHAVMANGKSLKPVLAILVVALLIIGIAGAKSGAFSSGSSSESSSSCGYCHRSFTDSGNNRSIARTGMCSNCAGNYKSMTGWLDSMG